MFKLIVLSSVALAASIVACSQSIDIREAHCQQRDLKSHNRTDTDLWEAEDWGAREAYSTEWSNSGNNVRCLTLIYDSIDDARWSLNYSTALQSAWSGEELLSHRQIVAPKVGQDTLAFEVDAKEHLATAIFFRRDTIVIMVETSYGTFTNPWLRQNVKQPTVDKPARIARAIDRRILSD